MKVKAKRNLSRFGDMAQAGTVIDMSEEEIMAWGGEYVEVIDEPVSVDESPAKPKKRK